MTIYRAEDPVRCYTNADHAGIVSAGEIVVDRKVADDMIIPNRIHTTIAKARMVREAKGRAFNCKRGLNRNAGIPQNNSLADKMTGGSFVNTLTGHNSNSTTSQLTEIRTKQLQYSRMETAAGQLFKSAEKMAGTAGNALFGQEEGTELKKEAVSEIKNFVNSYNLLLGHLNSSGEAVDTAYGKKLMSYASENAEMLKKAGITIGTGGKLSLDESRLKMAKPADLKAIFSEKNSFGEKTGKFADDIRKVAGEKIDELEKSLLYGSAGYTRKGISALEYDRGRYRSEA